MDDRWTLDELARRAGAALAGEAVRAPNGRIRDLPDARAIRWYATIGLVDRPLPGPGRSARYGPRHLLQLVAIKRRQAAGHSLADIQAELAGATDETLHRIARIPADEVLADDVSVPPPRARFWASGPTPDQASAPAAGTATRPAESEPELSLRPLRPRRVPAAPTRPVLLVRYQLDLPGGATLGLPYPPSLDDLAAIRSAADGLVAVLAARGLLDPDPPGAPDTPWTVATPQSHEGDAE